MLANQPSRPQHSDIGSTLEKTKDARYHAHRRLSKRAGWKSALLSMLSAYILLLSVFPRFIASSGATLFGINLDFLALSASLVLLVLSIFLAFDDDRSRAQGLHDNAWRIGTIFHSYKHAMRISAAKGEPPPLGEEQYAQYRQAIEACIFRHDEIDYMAVEIAIAKRAAKPYRMKRAAYLILYFLDVYGWPTASVGLSLLGITLFAKLLRP